MQAYVVEERRVAESRRSCRVINGMDSQVGLGALVKGRAASPALNRVLQRLCPVPVPFQISGDVYSCPTCFNTASNRADAPTKTSFPPGDLELPDWFDRLSSGDFTGFDRWMEEHEVPSGEARLPFEDICGVQDIDLRTARKEKAAAFQAKHVGADVQDQLLVFPRGKPALSVERSSAALGEPPQAAVLLCRGCLQF